MIRISNLRIEHSVPFKYGHPQTRVICDMEAEFTDVNQFWFSVDDKYGDWLTYDVYDAFLVALLYPAMYYGEDIDIRGNVSKKLLHNIKHYVQGLILAYDSNFHKIDIMVKGFSNAVKTDFLHVGTGFSGGIDSFSTLNDNFFYTDDKDYKIDVLFFFHVGQYGNVRKINTWERANNRFRITSDFANEIGVKAVMMNTNMFDFYLPYWEYDAGIICRISSILAFQKILKRYYISNTVTYKELAEMNLFNHHVDMAEMSDPIIMPLLSPDGLDILCDGAQHTRTEKTLNIIDLPLAQKYLNVCVNSSDDHVAATNCSVCSKCQRTLMALESSDALEKFKDVFNLRLWHKYSFRYKCEQIVKYKSDTFAKDNVDFARKRCKHLPNKFVAYTVTFFFKVVSLFIRVIRKIKRVINGF